jgi:two-component system, OmpR family, sensor histidine kinase VicK
LSDASHFTPTLIPEKTEVLYDANEIVRRVVERCYTVRYTMDGCIDTEGISTLLIPNHPITEAFGDMKKRGIRLRFISEITKDNLSSCKKLMEIGEIRHLDDIKGNFGITDGIIYYASATNKESAPPPQLIMSTVKPIVDQQQYFFDMLWKKALPAKQRIKEIEQGLKREFMETIQDPYEVQTVLNNILNSATEEILLTLPTKTTTLDNKRLYRYEQEYLIPLLRNAVARGVKIRLLFVKSGDKGMDKAEATK